MVLRRTPVVGPTHRGMRVHSYNALAGVPEADPVGARTGLSIPRNLVHVPDQCWRIRWWATATLDTSSTS